jgi:hypothetical protein
MALSGRNLSLMYLSLSSAARAIVPSAYSTPWWSSYMLLMPSSTATVSETEGSPMLTVWKRRCDERSELSETREFKSE